MSFTTGSLPADLPRFTASGADPSPGYVAFAAGNYGMVIDNTGRTVWYHRFPNGPGLNFQPQPNGRYTARPPTSSPGETGKWVEIDPLGNVTRVLGCADGLQARLHDLLAESNGSYWLMCDRIRTVDLSSSGGSPQAVVMGTGVQHISANGDVLFNWSPFDHIEVDLRDVDGADRTANPINWTHGNALDLDSDGNVLLSFRNLNEIIKINTQTGTVMWRMGGSHNQFTLVDVSAPAFARQHGVRSTGAGRLQLLDNLGDSRGSRAEHYAYDEQLRTLRLISSVASSAGVTALIGGTTQSLPADRFLVSFGNGGSVEEYDAAGNVTWKIDGNAGYVFRAERIRSLYHPGVGDAR
jgi:outer membrane protein assembly factor BamB